ncbi:hypothetical protein [Gluconobacter kondonii]|uniref:hypothetical protein n=1 Tax=Gluconobacter kondonii TaxID=941463 RepID=UPI0019821303|nr:hypothetical protein [Gluconobacter kondonii]MBN3868009.1 hypothetical protein [Gluconobacter kondonii]
MTEKAPNNIRGLINRARRASNRNTLALFMADHFSDLCEEIGARADWRTLTEFFVSQGLKDACGQTPSPETARQTWYRVRRRQATEQQNTPSAVVPKVRFPDSARRPEVTALTKPPLVPGRPADNSIPGPESPQSDALAMGRSVSEKLRRAEETIRSGALPLPPRVGAFGTDKPTSR